MTLPGRGHSGRLLLVILAAALPAFASGWLWGYHDPTPAQRLGLVLVVGLGLAVAWIAVVDLLALPLAPVLATVRRVAQGDLTARTPEGEASHDEIHRLAREVDLMAEALARRDQALSEALNRAQAYLDVVGVMVLLLNPRGNVMLANHKACEVLGRDGRQCQGADWFHTFLPQDEQDAARRVFLDLLSGQAEDAAYQEYPVLDADGRPHLIAWHHRLLRDAAGQALGLLSAGQDITELRRTEDELRDSRERYRTLVENLPGAVYRCTLHPPRRVEFISPAVAELTGIPARNFLQAEPCLRDLVHPEERAAVDEAIAEGIAGHQPFTLVYRIRHADGGWRWAQERGQAMYDQEGRPVWLDGVILDITELRQLQEEQARLTSQLQQAQKMEALGHLTGGIAHDFNNILAAVLGFAKLALRRHVPDPASELADYLREVISAGERARDLVSRMLAFSRAQPAGSVQPIAPLPLIKEAVKMLRATIPAPIAIAVEAPDALPDVAMDPVDLHQILVNLVINARDALERQGRGRIRIGLARERARGQVCAACHERILGDYVVLTVADDGEGIAPEALPHIFEPFFTTKEVGKGSGMGLAMVYGLVRRARGHFQVESTPGLGTTFQVFLPESSPGAAAAPAPVPAPSALPAGRGHLLVVDDEPSLARLLGDGLAAAGWRVSAFTDARAALEAFRAQPGDYLAVISDLAMPHMTGVELIRALRAIHPGLPAILCSGHGLDAAAFADLARLCQKPVDMDELNSLLVEIASSKKTPAR